MTCDDNYSNTIFFYVDAVNYTNTFVGCAQRTLDNSDWDWNATEQLVGVDGIKYTNDNYVKLAVLRKGDEFYLICNDRLAIYYDSFNVFGAYQNSAVGFLTFNTPLKIKNYSATTDASVIAEKSRIYADSINGESFGKPGEYSSTSGWNFADDRGDNPNATQTLTGDQYAYFKNFSGTQFYVETEISVTQDMGDPFPKFGIFARNGSNTFFFYIDGSASYTAKRVGYVSRINNGDWGWGNAQYNAETPVPAMGDYKDGKYVKLGLLRDGNTFKMYVNDELVLTVTDVEGFGAADESVCGILSFTTGINIKNYSVTADVSKIK